MAEEWASLKSQKQPKRASLQGRWCLSLRLIQTGFLDTDGVFIAGSSFRYKLLCGAGEQAWSTTDYSGDGPCEAVSLKAKQHRGGPLNPWYNSLILVVLLFCKM